VSSTNLDKYVVGGADGFSKKTRVGKIAEEKYPPTTEVLDSKRGNLACEKDAEQVLEKRVMGMEQFQI